MDVRTVLAAQKYTASKPATGPAENAQGGNALFGLAKDFAATLQESEQVSMQAMTGKADPHTLVQALAQTELAVEKLAAGHCPISRSCRGTVRAPMRGVALMSSAHAVALSRSSSS